MATVQENTKPINKCEHLPSDLLGVLSLEHISPRSDQIRTNKTSPITIDALIEELSFEPASLIIHQHRPRPDNRKRFKNTEHDVITALSFEAKSRTDKTCRSVGSDANKLTLSNGVDFIAELSFEPMSIRTRRVCTRLEARETPLLNEVDIIAALSFEPVILRNDNVRRSIGSFKKSKALSTEVDLIAALSFEYGSCSTLDAKKASLYTENDVRTDLSSQSINAYSDVNRVSHDTKNCQIQALPCELISLGSEEVMRAIPDVSLENCVRKCNSYDTDNTSVLTESDSTYSTSKSLYCDVIKEDRCIKSSHEGQHELIDDCTVGTESTKDECSDDEGDSTSKSLYCDVIKEDTCINGSHECQHELIDDCTVGAESSKDECSDDEGDDGRKNYFPEYYKINTPLKDSCAASVVREGLIRTNMAISSAWNVTKESLREVTPKKRKRGNENSNINTVVITPQKCDIVEPKMPSHSTEYEDSKSSECSTNTPRINNTFKEQIATRLSYLSPPITNLTSRLSDSAKRIDVSDMTLRLADSARKIDVAEVTSRLTDSAKKIKVDDVVENARWAGKKGWDFYKSVRLYTEEYI